MERQGLTHPCSVRDGTKIENVLDWNLVVKKYYDVVKRNSGEGG